MSGSRIRLYGSTSGYVELEAPAVGDDGVLSLPTAADGFGAAGIGSNVVQTVKTDTFATASATLVDVTGLSVTITPTSATSKVLVFWSRMYGNSSGSGGALAQIVRDSTNVYIGTGGSTNASHVSYDSASAEMAHMMSGVLLDSPATTSAVTYKVQLHRTDTGTAYVGRMGFSSGIVFPSQITAIEVAA